MGIHRCPCMWVTSGLPVKAAPTSVNGMEFPPDAVALAAVDTQTAGELRERLIESNQTQIEVDLPEDDSMAVLMGGGDDNDRAEDDDMSEEKLLRALMAAQDKG